MSSIVAIVLVLLVFLAGGLKILSHMARKWRAERAKEILFRPNFLETVRKEKGEEAWRNLATFIINTLNNRVEFQYRSKKEGYYLVALDPDRGIGEPSTYYFPGHNMNGNYRNPDHYFETKEQAVNYFYGTLVPEILDKLKEEYKTK